MAGTSGKALLEGGSDDEGSSTEAHGRAIIEVLGRDKRNVVLAAVYMVRSDVTLSVRQASDPGAFYAHYYPDFSILFMRSRLNLSCLISKFTYALSSLRLLYMFGRLLWLILQRPLKKLCLF